MPWVVAGVAAAGAIAGAVSGSQGSRNSSKTSSGVNLYDANSFEGQTLGTYKRVLNEDQQAKMNSLGQELENLQKNGSPDIPWSSKSNRIKAIQKEMYGLATNPLGSQQMQKGDVQNFYDQLKGYGELGPNGSDITRGVNASRALADQYGEYAKSGGLPSQTDINSGNDISNNLFSARQVGLNQNFLDQSTQANRDAARLGRSVNDPVLQAKLRTGFMRQQDSLNAEKQGTAQQIALSLPGQRLGYAASQADVLNNLSMQAFQNKTTLLGLGNQLGSAERDFRLRTSPTWGNQSGQSGGGLAGGINGGIAGAGAGLSAASAFQNSTNFSNAFNSGGSTPSYTQPASNGGYNLGNFRY